MGWNYLSIPWWCSHWSLGMDYSNFIFHFIRHLSEEWYTQCNLSGMCQKNDIHNAIIFSCFLKLILHDKGSSNINGLMQKRHNSIANALKLRLFCIKLSIWCCKGLFFSASCPYNCLVLPPWMYRLLHSPSLVVIGLSAGQESWPQSNWLI